MPAVHRGPFARYRDGPGADILNPLGQTSHNEDSGQGYDPDRLEAIDWLLDAVADQNAGTRGGQHYWGYPQAKHGLVDGAPEDTGAGGYATVNREG